MIWQKGIIRAQSRSRVARAPLALALIFSALVTGPVNAVPASFAASGSNLSTFYLLGLELGPWEDYLLKELTPNLKVVSELPAPRISWIAGAEDIVLPQFARELLNGSREYGVSFGYQSSINTRFGAELSASLTDRFSPRLLDRGDVSLKREFLSSGISRQLSENNLVGVSAILAYQRFSAAGLGFVAASEPNDVMLNRGSDINPFEESTFGTGVRLALSSELLPGMAFDAGFQSRIDMEEFNNYRGVYSEPAELDIPAKAHIGLSLKASKNASFTFGIDHVLYSDVGAFPSRFLPERVVSLLGDSSSPELAWDDLTVYSIGWRWEQKAGMEWRLDLTTRQQPNPTAAVLERALAGDLANNAMLLGFRKQTSRNGWLNVTAAYAPPEYVFGGSVLGVTSDDLDQSLEVEALWVWNF